MDYAAEYGRLHKENLNHFSGYSTKVSVSNIAALVEQIKPKRILDYGSGKGYQYLELRMHEKWGGILPHCFDPGVKQLKRKPDGKFGGIICSDVMEHIERRDVNSTLRDIFSRAEERAFVYFRIGTSLAKYNKILSDGRNVHVTVMPEEWWNKQMEQFQREGLVIEIAFDGKNRVGR